MSEGKSEEESFAGNECVERVFDVKEGDDEDDNDGKTAPFLILSKD